MTSGSTHHLWKHGCAKAKTREYRAWRGMRSRCHNERDDHFRWYGGRGIRIAVRWDDFENFLADMGQCPHGHSLDRIDVNGNYEPGNCRWASATTQARNRRSHRRLAFDGQTMCVSEWAEKLGLDVHLIFNRLRRGWSVQRALSTPMRRYRKEDRS